MKETTAPTPPRARTTDPETSQAAAAALTAGQIYRSQRTALRLLLRFGPMTLAQVVGKTSRAMLSSSRVRSAVAEMVRAGHVQDSGLRERQPSGRNAIIWSLTTSGTATAKAAQAMLDTRHHQ